jgi:transcription initiation factor TFIIIB Brf1 subunit/transcription initiation factor TFIIB
MEKCPWCSGTTVSPEGPKGEKVCTNCGLVIDNTSIIFSFKHWNPKWYSNWSPEDPETLKEWLTTLRAVSCQLKIPRFPYQEEAALKIRKAKSLFFQSQRFAKNKRATIAALIHLVLKEYNKIRSIKEICQELSLDTKSVLKQAWILKALNTEKDLLKIQRKTSKDYLLEYAIKVTNNKELLAFAEKTLAKIQNKGGNPISLAAGALYYASKTTMNPISKSQIGEAFHISPRTIDTNERRIRNIMVILANQKNTSSSKQKLVTIQIKNN